MAVFLFDLWIKKHYLSTKLSERHFTNRQLTYFMKQNTIIIISGIIIRPPYIEGLIMV